MQTVYDKIDQGDILDLKKIEFSPKVRKKSDSFGGIKNFSFEIQRIYHYFFISYGNIE